MQISMQAMYWEAFLGVTAQEERGKNYGLAEGGDGLHCKFSKSLICGDATGHLSSPELS